MVYDALLLFAVLFFASFLVLPLTYTATPEPHIESSPWYSMYLFLVSYFYFALSWKKGGSTVGMIAWKFKLQTMDQSPLQWSHTLLRFMVAMIPLALYGLAGYWWLNQAPLPAIIIACLIASIIFFWPLFDKNNHGLHDKYSETELVNRPRK